MTPAKRRQKKVNAAVEALVPIGFSRAVIRKTINSLLKEYGDDGWAFIAEDSYELVVNTILKEQQEEEEDGRKMVALPPVSLPDKVDAGDDANASGETIAVSEASSPQHQAVADTRADGSIGWKDISCMGPASRDISLENNSQSPCQLTLTAREIQVPCNVSPLSRPSDLHEPVIPLKPRRKPCYGWLSEEDDSDVDNLSEKQHAGSVGGTSQERKRNQQETAEYVGGSPRVRRRVNRWDEKPLVM